MVLSFQERPLGEAAQKGHALQGPSSSTATADAADLASFNKLTECASALMDSGELDVYSMVSMLLL